MSLRMTLNLTYTKEWVRLICEHLREVCFTNFTNTTTILLLQAYCIRCLQSKVKLRGMACTLCVGLYAIIYGIPLLICNWSNCRMYNWYWSGCWLDEWLLMSNEHLSAVTDYILWWSSTWSVYCRLHYRMQQWKFSLETKAVWWRTYFTKPMLSNKYNRLRKNARKLKQNIDDPQGGGLVPYPKHKTHVSSTGLCNSTFIA